jgi:hypothetical protein
MGIPTSEVSCTLAITGRGDHEVHKGHVVTLAQNISMSDGWFIYKTLFLDIMNGTCIMMILPQFVIFLKYYLLLYKEAKLIGATCTYLAGEYVFARNTWCRILDIS